MESGALRWKSGPSGPRPPLPNTVGFSPCESRPPDDILLNNSRAARGSAALWTSGGESKFRGIGDEPSPETCLD